VTVPNHGSTAGARVMSLRVCGLLEVIKSMQDAWILLKTLHCMRVVRESCTLLG
jgi:hypothetical protein